MPFVVEKTWDENRLKRDRLEVLVFLSDPSVALAAMLAGDTQLATDSAMNATRAATLLRQWPPGRGVLVNYFNQWPSASFQGRPDGVSMVFLTKVTKATRPPAHGYRTRVISDGVNPSLHMRGRVRFQLPQSSAEPYSFQYANPQPTPVPATVR